MADMTLLAFDMVAFVGIATPAPTVLLALSDGSKFGIPCTLTGMARAILSDFVLIGAVALGLGLGLGLGALLAASEFWFNVVKWVGVCYLVFLASCCFAPEASSTARCNRQIGTGQHPRARSSSKHSGRGDQPQGLSVLFCFPAAVHQPFSAANSAICVLALVFAAIDFIVMFGYALLGAQPVRMLPKSGALRLDRICGGALLTLAASLAPYRRVST